MNSEDYEKQVKAKGDMKRFDFIHMIQVLWLCVALWLLVERQNSV